MMSFILLNVSILICVLLSFVCADITDLNTLYNTIKNGKGKQLNVGFLSQGNYEVVQNTLPNNTIPLYFGSLDQLELAVSNGTVIAGLVSQVAPAGFNTFSAGILSPQAMFMNRSSSPYLLQAIDAAIVEVIQSGGVQQFARDNYPTLVSQINTCYANKNYYPFPSSSLVSSEPWYINKVIRVGALGPNNWGVSGNYKVNPPTGFWPDYFNAIENQLNAALGVKFQRVYFKNTPTTLHALLNGTVDITEPYFLLDGYFNGRGRNYEFTVSCATVGSGSYYFTKVSPPSSSSATLSPGVIAGIVIGSIAGFICLCFLIFLIFKERKGEPLFMPIPNSDVDNNKYGSTAGNIKSDQVVTAEGTIGKL